MNTGSLSRAHSSQMGSRSGSSIFSRVPSAFLIERPSPFPISPTPTAPAATSASSCAMAFWAQPGPTFLKSIPARMRTRSCILAEAFTAAIAFLRRSPERLSAETIMRTLSASSARPSESSPCSEKISWLGMPVIIDRRILRRLHHVRVGDERRARPVVEDARRRELGRHAGARADFRLAERAGRVAGGEGRAAAAAAATAAAGGLLGVQRRGHAREDRRGG